MGTKFDGLLKQKKKKSYC